MILVCKIGSPAGNTHFCQGPFIGSCHQYLQESCQLGTSYGSSCWRNSKGAKVVKLSYVVRCVFKSLIDDLLSLNVCIIITINHPCNYQKQCRLRAHLLSLPFFSLGTKPCLMPAMSWSLSSLYSGVSCSSAAYSQH